MPKINHIRYAIIFLAILVSLVVVRNLIITGNITGEQLVVKIGFLKEDTNCYHPRIDCALAYMKINDDTEYGINLALPSFFESYRTELVVGDFSDFSSSIEDFKNSDVKAILTVRWNSISKVLEVKDDDTILFSSNGYLSFHDLVDPVFFLRDFFQMPVLVIADNMHNYGVKKVGVVYVTSPIEFNNSILDYSEDFYNPIFEKIVGEIAFTATYHSENRSNSKDIINLINSTGTEAIAFLGHGTNFEEFYDMLSEIRNNIAKDIKIYSIGRGSKTRAKDIKIYSIGEGSKTRVFDFPETFNDLFIVETDYFPEMVWKEIMSNQNIGEENFIYIENPDDIHMGGDEIFLPENFGSIYFGRNSGISHSHTVEGYIFTEIFKDSLKICGDDMNCIKEKLYENTFDTIIGRVKFRKNGVIIRPYLLNKIEKGVKGPVTLKRYNLSDIEKIISDYNLDFLN